MEKTAEIVIMGGGIIGVSIAYHLAQKKARGVLLLEKGTVGEGATAKCAGGIRVQFSTEINRGWAGSYEISPDHHAILGEVPESPGFFLANGFSGHGFQHSPAAGRLMAELILGETPFMDVSCLSIERFRKGQFIHEPLTAFKE